MPAKDVTQHRPLEAWKKSATRCGWPAISEDIIGQRFRMTAAGLHVDLPLGRARIHHHLVPESGGINQVC